MAVVYGRRGRNRSAGEVYGLGRVGLGAQVGDSCVLTSGQPGYVQEWYDVDMGMVIGMICTADPPGTRIYRHSSGPSSSFSDPNPVPLPPPPPPPNPFAAGRVVGGACQVNGQMGTFMRNAAGDLECSLSGVQPPPIPVTRLDPGPVPPLVNLAPPPELMPATGAPLAMPSSSGGGGDVAAGGLSFAQGVGAVAAIVAAAYLLRKR